MTKLEQKLIELGYSQDKDFSFTYQKVNKGVLYVIYLSSKDKKKVNDSSVESIFSIHNQYDIDNLQQAFNQLQIDLEVLKEC